METRELRTAALICSLVVGCQASEATTTETSAFRFTPPIAVTGETAPTAEAQASWAPQEGLETLLQRAVEESPEVRRAYQVWQAALQQRPQVTALPDPWLSFTGYVQSVETRTGPMDGRIGITQMIPWPGKLDAAGEVASARAEAQRLAVETARLKVRQRFLRSWIECSYLQESRGITEAQVVLLGHIEDVSLRLYESSRVSQADVLRAQVERLEMQDRVDSLLQREATLIAAMEAVLGAPMIADGSWEGVERTALPDLVEEEQLRRSLLAASPELQRFHALLLAAEHGQAVAELEGRPDLSVGADWTWIGNGNPVQPGAGDDAFALSFAIELPLGTARTSAGRHQALAERKQAVAGIESRRWQLLASMQEALSSHEDALRRVALFEEQLLPLSEQTYETSLAAYQSGQAGFQDMLDAARVMLDFRLSSLRAATDASLAVADLRGLLPDDLLFRTSLER